LQAESAQSPFQDMGHALGTVSNHARAIEVPCKVESFMTRFHVFLQRLSADQGALL